LSNKVEILMQLRWWLGLFGYWADFWEISLLTNFLNSNSKNLLKIFFKKFNFKKNPLTIRQNLQNRKCASSISTAKQPSNQHSLVIHLFLAFHFIISETLRMKQILWVKYTFPFQNKKRHLLILIKQNE